MTSVLQPIKRAGPYLPLLVFCVVTLLLLSASRLGLVLWQFDRVTAAADIGILLLQGVRADLIFIGLSALVAIKKPANIC